MAAEIVVLGGGVGGTLTANLLARKLRNGKDARIRLVDATGVHAYQPGWLYVALDQANASWLARDVRSLLRDGVELIVDRADAIDTDRGVVRLERGGELPWDHLVIATGAGLDHDAVPGLRTGAHDFYSLTGAERLREALRGFTGGTLVVGVAGMPYKCPPAPVEFALLADEYLRRRGIRERTTLRFLSPINRAFTIESASRLVQPILDKRGIELHTFVNVEAVDPEGHELSLDPPICAGGAPVWTRQAAPRPTSGPFGACTRPVRSGSRRERPGFSPSVPTATRPGGPAERPAITHFGGSRLSSLEGETFTYDLAVLVPPHRGAAAVSESGLADSGGWLPTDRETLRVGGRERIYAIGDATDLPISKSGSTAHFEAPVIAEQIAAAVEGREPDPKRGRYGGKVTCFLEVGNGKGTILVFDYEHPPAPPRPSRRWHAAKWLFNRLYWLTVPQGRI